MPLPAVARIAAARYGEWLLHAAPPTTQTFVAIMESCAASGHWLEALRLCGALDAASGHAAIFAGALGAVPLPRWDLALQLTNFVLQRQAERIAADARGTAAPFDRCDDDDDDNEEFDAGDADDGTTSKAAASNELMWADDAFVVGLMRRLSTDAADGAMVVATAAAQPTAGAVTGNKRWRAALAVFARLGVVSVPTVHAVACALPPSPELRHAALAPLQRLWSARRGRPWKW